jgi:hypothetical protein
MFERGESAGWVKHAVRRHVYGDAVSTAVRRCLAASLQDSETMIPASHQARDSLAGKLAEEPQQREEKLVWNLIDRASRDGISTLQSGG